MQVIPLMINGLPGNMAQRIAAHAVRDERFQLLPWSFTGPEISETEYLLDDQPVRLVRPAERDAVVREIKTTEENFLTIDFTHPSAVNDNAAYYCRTGMPFVMGTTGGDREQLVQMVEAADIPAVIAPNMAKQIVGFQAMMAYAAENFPGLFEDYTLDIRESHQNGKADTSGTAKAMVTCFNRLGCPFSEADIRKERDPDVQRREWGVPDHFLDGHAWHTYTLTSDDGTVRFSFTHNVNGREIYVKGTLDAVVYLAEKIRQGNRGRVYTMIDVLKNR